MTNLLISIPFVLLCLLLLRLLIAHWSRGGATLALVLVFFVELIAFDLLFAIISVALLLVFVPTLARSPLGGQLLRLLIRVTDPLVELVRRGTAGQVSGSPAIVIAALLMLGVYIASLLVLRR